MTVSGDDNEVPQWYAIVAGIVLLLIGIAIGVVINASLFHFGL